MIGTLARCLLLAAVCLAAPVPQFPGFNGVMPSAMYSGYITVDPTDGRRIFYIFVEAQQSPKTAPLVLWLNGGPGCSGMFGFFTEHGPFNMNFTANGTGVELNPYSWTTIANVIYIESPAGVGFSSSNNTEDYKTGDRRTANDSLQFLLNFYKKFPQFRSNDFWVTGESYGGHYVPELTYTILMYNKNAGSNAINLVGMMAGNPWTAPEHEAFGVPENWWNRGIISKETYTDVLDYCTYKDITAWIIYNVSAATLSGVEGETTITDRKSKCYDALINACLKEFSGVNILGVYLDVCGPGHPGTRGDIPDQPNYCHTSQMTTFLNLDWVQQALHVSNPKPPQWAPCSAYVTYNFTDTVRSVLYAYEYILEKTNLSVLVFSGDQDAIVPFTATRKWLEVLRRPIKTPLHQWWATTNGLQVGGWATEYDRFTFTTVRDAGHMVAMAEPQRALKMFHDFLKYRKL